jgi:hypothetical protein
MNESLRIWMKSFRLLVFAGLAISVFMWGLGYKLSLYDVQQASVHRIPMAKLLSGDENYRSTGRASGSASADSPHSGIIVAPILALLAILAAVSKLNSEVRSFKMPPPRSFVSRAVLNAFFFRPPPSFARI